MRLSDLASSANSLEVMLDLIDQGVLQATDDERARLEGSLGLIVALLVRPSDTTTEDA